MFHLTPQEEKVLKLALIVMITGALVQVSFKRHARMIGWIKGGVDLEQPLDVNRAGLEELEAVAGIGPKTAARILEYRRREGDLKDLRELLKIKGMTQERYERLKEHLKL